jgi:hypothetical protein
VAGLANTVIIVEVEEVEEVEEDFLRSRSTSGNTSDLDTEQTVNAIMVFDNIIAVN